MNIQTVEQQAYALLDQLPEFLYYHNKQHTKDVVEAATYLGAQQCVTEEEACLLQTAALLHDTGFINSVTGINHEKESCSIAKQILPFAGYDREQVRIVQNLIISTKLPQSPCNLLEEILCDADLFYIGTDRFFEVSQLLYLELASLQKIEGEKQWYHLQVQFLSSHCYFTTTAQEQLEPKKRIHLQSVIKKQATLL